jgi:hypothetical protein
MPSSVDRDQVFTPTVDENDGAVGLSLGCSGEKKRQQSARESSHVPAIIHEQEVASNGASRMTGPGERRAATPPHCYRVVQLGLTMKSEAARGFAERTSGEIARAGKRIRAGTLFEPKVGGGGHLLLLDEDAGTTWARVLVEPDGAIVSLVAAILDGDWDSSDEALATQVRDWMTSLLGIGAGAFTEGPPNGGAHSAESPNGR